MYVIVCLLMKVISCLKKAVLGAALGSIFFSLPSQAALKIGILMPSQNQDRWYNDGHNLKQKLADAGFEVDLYHGGDDDINLQLRQAKRVIEEGYNLLIIAPIDGKMFKDVLADAKKKHIKVISYDRLIMNTDAVSYYITFDNKKVGRMQGQFIADRLRLDTSAVSHNLELVGGAPTDNNAKIFYNGAMEVLKPYIESGKLKVPSGEVAFDAVATQNWSNVEAAKRLDTIIKDQGYADGQRRLDAIYCSSDGLARGAVLALNNNRFDPEKMPVITGQDCTKPVVELMAKKQISMSILKNIGVLADKTVDMVRQIDKGSEVTVNDNSYNNGAINPPTYLCEPKLVTSENWKRILIDEEGIYKESDFNL